MQKTTRLLLLCAPMIVLGITSNVDAQFFRRGMVYRHLSPQIVYPATQVHTTKTTASKKRQPYRPKSYSGHDVGQNQYYQSKYRHVYQPVKNGLTKKGANGQTLILAEYVGTHVKDPNEQQVGDFQDLQHGTMSQQLIKTSKTARMWKEPLLDGTLRWVPLIPKKTNATPNARTKLGR